MTLAHRNPGDPGHIADTNEIIDLVVGPTGKPLPAGGTAGQALTKNTSTDFDAGWQTLAGPLTPTTIKNSAYTVAAGDLVRADASAGNVPIAVPPAPTVGFLFVVTLVAVSGGFNCTVTLGGSDLFQSGVGPSSKALVARDQVLMVEYAGANVWSVLMEPQLPLAPGYATTPNTSNVAQVGIDVLSNVQTFTTPGAFTWVMPSWATASSQVVMEVVAGGGGGASGRRGATSTVRGAGGGGQAGFRSKVEFVAGDLPGTVAGQVGQGGAGGAQVLVDTTDGADGGAGTASFVGKYVYASGGQGGKKGDSTDGGVGGTTVAGARGMWPGAPGAKGGGLAAAQDLNVTEFGVYTAAQLTPVPIGSGGGGGGAGINASNGASVGSAGGDVNGYADGTTVGGIAGAGSLGGDVGKVADAFAGSGGGGGGRASGSNSLAGGIGVNGSGGGGAGGALNGFQGGSGGNGGNGVVRVTTRP